MENNSFYIKPLDGIRGFAVLMVMFFHYNLIDYNTIFNGMTSIVKFGQTGVTLFFVLSGFLITRILIKAKNKENYFSHFYLRRTLRIFPLYYFFLLLTYFVLPYLNLASFVSFKEQIPFYLFYQNIAYTFEWACEGPSRYWSLAVEEHFYLIWPLIMYFFSIKNCYRIIILIGGIAILFRILLLKEGYGTFYFTLCRMDAIAIGCYVALMEFESNYNLKINWNKHLVVLSVIALVFGYLWFVYSEKSNLYIQIIKDIPYYYIFSILIMAMVSKESHYLQNIVKNFFNNKFLIFCGKLSFSLYVYHVMCYDIVGKIGISNIYISILACFGLSFIIASISFFYFETPFLKLKNRFSDV